MAFSETLTDYQPVAADLPAEFEYRAFSTSAIASAIFGAISPLTIVAGRDSLESALLISPIPLLGLALGWYALSKIRAMPDQLSGRRFAIAGIVLSLIGLIAGLSYAGMVHATEVPEGATRTSFYDLRPDEKDERAGIPIPKEIQELNNKRVFIKGYFRPDSSPTTRNVRRFLLVRDNNQCCFGDASNVKYFDQVLVDFVDNLTTDYKSGLFRIAGTLRLQPQNLLSGSQMPVYFIQADYVQ
jgi:hypothetical protein